MQTGDKMTLIVIAAIAVMFLIFAYLIAKAFFVITVVVISRYDFSWARPSNIITGVKYLFDRGLLKDHDLAARSVRAG